MIRTGLGQDSHKLVRDKGRLVLGGVVVSKDYYLESDADGDVVIHSLCNALSTAIGGGSLDSWAGKMNKEGITDSREFLKVIVNKVNREEYKINNVAVMVEAKEPRLEEKGDKIKASLAKLLNIKKDQAGVAFTSGEGLTSFGKGKGVQAWTVVTIEK